MLSNNNLVLQEKRQAINDVGPMAEAFTTTSQDTRLDKTKTLTQLQELFSQLLIQSKTIADSPNPEIPLAALLTTAFQAIYPKSSTDLTELTKCIIALKFEANPTEREKQTAYQDLERQSISVATTAIRSLLSDLTPVIQGKLLLSTEEQDHSDYSRIFERMIRSRALQGLKPTLHHSGSLSPQTVDLSIPLKSTIPGEPYEALSMLNDLSRLNTTRSEHTLRAFSLPATARNSAQLSEFLSARYQELNPQVLAVIEEAVVDILRELLKKEPLFTGNQKLQNQYESVNWDPIRLLDLTALDPDHTQMTKLKQSILDQLNKRLVTDMLTTTLASWEALPGKSYHYNPSAPDVIDGIIAIRQRRKAIPWEF